MIILGHDYFEHKPFYRVNSIDSILHTPSKSTLYISYAKESIDIIDHCRLNKLSFAIGVKSVKEALFAHNFHANYIIVSRIMAPSIQKIAETYLFDAKILARIENEDELEEMASLGIDGVIFAQGIIKESNTL